MAAPTHERWSSTREMAQGAAQKASEAYAIARSTEEATRNLPELCKALMKQLTEAMRRIQLLEADLAAKRRELPLPKGARHVGSDPVPVRDQSVRYRPAG